MKVLITGSQGFIGKNLITHLTHNSTHKVFTFNRSDDLTSLPQLVSQVDVIVHLAGINRSNNHHDFVAGNTDLTSELCKSVLTEIANTGRDIFVFFSSSIQCTNSSVYGQSKLLAEQHLKVLSAEPKAHVAICRLPNIFGKWCKPNYNSFVATFCSNIVNELPCRIDDPEANVSLLYIDDLVSFLFEFIENPLSITSTNCFVDPPVPYVTTVGQVYDLIKSFHASRSSLLIDHVGVGFKRALYSTYLSYLSVSDFSYKVAQHTDARGSFVEMIKTQSSGQISYFTAHPGVTRGGHFHHTKNEQFLVIVGTAKFCFKHLATGETSEIFVSSSLPQIVLSIPGWSHDITNVGSDDMVVILWSNEIFDHANPDTFFYPL